MKLHLLSAALLAMGGCSAEGPGGSGYPPFNSPGGSGAGGQGGGGAGQPASGRGSAGTSPAAGSGGQPSAGTSALGGSGGQQGGSGTSTPTAGTTGLGGAGASGGAGAGGQPPAAGSTGTAAGTVTVEFTTATYGGQYAPLNYGAVWFENPGGTFIKTAKRWAGTIHASDLATWTAASGGWSIFGGNMADMMDAMSSATLRTHQKHTVMWNMMGTNMQVVPDGPYVAVVEMTEDRALTRAGPVVRIPFMKGPAPQMVEAASVETITGVVLRYQP